MKSRQHLILLACFLFLFGCGESSMGEAKSATPEAASPSVAEVATASGDSQPGASLDTVAPVDYVEGTHYLRLDNPVPTTVDKSKIEVMEVFWYGCSHCYHFEPLINAWAENQPDDVAVAKNPAMWDNQGIMERHARIYYSAKALGALDKISPAAFRALNVENRQLRTDEEVEALFVDNGVNREAFEKTFNSFGITSAVRQAEARQRGYGIQGTPELIVDGTYRITATMAGSQEAMLKIADYLADKVRAEK